MEWWHWLVTGLALCASELVVPAFVLVWLGLAALVLALVTAVLSITLTSQLLLWAILSGAMVLLWLRVFRPSDMTTRSGTPASIIGEVGLLVRDVRPFQPGQVLFQRPLMGADRWECVADKDMPAGSRVRVLAVEGNTLKVECCEN